MKREPYALAEHIRPDRGPGCGVGAYIIAGLLVLAVIVAACWGLHR